MKSIFECEYLPTQLWQTKMLCCLHPTKGVRNSQGSFSLWVQSMRECDSNAFSHWLSPCIEWFLMILGGFRQCRLIMLDRITFHKRIICRISNVNFLVKFSNRRQSIPFDDDRLFFRCGLLCSGYQSGRYLQYNVLLTVTLVVQRLVKTIAWPH